jgi:hypothetical protein
VYSPSSSTYIVVFEVVVQTQALMMWAPEEVGAALRPALEKVLTGKQQDEDRPATCAAIEVLSGLLNAETLYSPQGMHV